MSRAALLIGVVAAVGVACNRIPPPVAPQVTNSAPPGPSVTSTTESITSHSEASEQDPPKSDFQPKENPFLEEDLEPCEIDHRAIVEAELVAYVTDFLSPINRTRDYRRRLRLALKYIPVILDLVEQDIRRYPLDPLDPLLVAVKISYESSWDPEVIGALGEQGYLQVHGPVALGRFEKKDLADPANQLAAGIEHLRRAALLCPGDWRGALNMYGTGKRCRPLAKFVKRRWKSYQRALKLFRKEKDHETRCKTSGRAPEAENP
ncbi:MAG: lytic transglycosylase domain-containing protein [Desulfuromonadales bacterium]|nr:lytic transglycosylase domain-containing protein [Desulfuromonadales bacterium]